MTPDQENQLFKCLGRIEGGMKSYGEQFDRHIKEADEKFISLFRSRNRINIKLAVCFGAFLVINFLVLAWLRGSISFGG